MEEQRHISSYGDPSRGIRRQSSTRSQGDHHAQDRGNSARHVPLPSDYDSPARRKGRETLESRPSRREAEAAVRTLIRWAGDDPGREGLLDTPKRVVRSYAELFSGYHADPRSFLERTFK